MQHWYVYHSQETMGYDYSSLKSSAVFSTNAQSKLCFNDVIWVIEGDKSSPKNFHLVDCFINSKQEYPPFTHQYSKFKLKVIGNESLIKHSFKLNKEDECFSKLHAEFITKQRFFNVLPSEIYEGLIKLP